jgi:enediyne biosynthesis protein E3
MQSNAGGGDVSADSINSSLGTNGASTVRETFPAFPLPMRMADFERRGFHLGRPAARAVLEGHARSFLTGYNLAARHWRDRHDVLAEVPAEERGFAYEGAGMYAAQRDLLTGGAAGGLRGLLDGPGAGYVHLIHVGAGWILAPMRLPLPRVPGTPLMRWLALDGAGFGRTFFGGLGFVARQCERSQGPGESAGRWVATVAGVGRALWFVQSADVQAAAGTIRRQPEAARPHLWSGIGLAAGYAGATSVMELRRLLAAAAEHRAHLRQGVTFAAGARVRSGIVPAHTELACRELLGVDAGTAAGWTDTDAVGLTDSPHLNAYLEWRSRLRRRFEN